MTPSKKETQKEKQTPLEVIYGKSNVSQEQPRSIPDDLYKLTQDEIVMHRPDLVPYLAKAWLKLGEMAEDPLKPVGRSPNVYCDNCYAKFKALEKLSPGIAIGLSGAPIFKIKEKEIEIAQDKAIHAQLGTVLSAANQSQDELRTSKEKEGFVVSNTELEILMDCCTNLGATREKLDSLGRSLDKWKEKSEGRMKVLDSMCKD